MAQTQASKKIILHLEVWLKNVYKNTQFMSPKESKAAKDKSR